MTERERLKSTVSNHLGDRHLVWAGLRGDDIQPLADLPQLTASFSMIGEYKGRSTVESVTHEQLSGQRHDMETWDIDDHLDDPATHQFRSKLFRVLASPSALLPYRPSRFLSAIHFARRDRCAYLGQFGAFQAAFEHKPWVESGIRDLGLPCVPWTYVADEEQMSTMRSLCEGPLVLRRSRTSGGEGFELVEDAEQLLRRWPHTPEGFVSVAPYIPDTVPVNVGGTVWRDGVTVHYPSVQLIGIECCVGRSFGYCGNDFSAATRLDPTVIHQIEGSTVEVGEWLLRHGYRGTFGMDFMVSGDTALFTEVNPRFQGSTVASARLSYLEGEACLYLEHLAAMFGEPAPSGTADRWMAAASHPLSTIVVHWLDETAAVDLGPLISAVRTWEPGARVDVLPSAGVRIDRGGVACRITVQRSVTDDGAALDPALAEIIERWKSAPDQADLDRLKEAGR